MSKLSIKVAVACYDPNGDPALYMANVSLSKHQFDFGLHLTFAVTLAQEAGYHEPFIPYPPAHFHVFQHSEIYHASMDVQDMQSAIDTLTQDIVDKGFVKPLSGRIQAYNLYLSALVKKEFTTTVNLPAEFGSRELDDLARLAFDLVEVDLYRVDEQYWVRDECNFEPA